MPVVAIAAYEAMLEELRCRRDELDTSIRVVERVIAEGKAGRPPVAAPIELPPAVTVVYDAAPKKNKKRVHPPSDVRHAGRGIHGALNALGAQVLRVLYQAPGGRMERWDIERRLTFAEDQLPGQRFMQQSNATLKLKRLGLVVRDGVSWVLTDKGAERVASEVRQP